ARAVGRGGRSGRTRRCSRRRGHVGFPRFIALAAPAAAELGRSVACRCANETQEGRVSTVWKFEHTVKVRASRDAAWAYWSNVANWVEVDPAVEWARIDGAFETGSRGETKPIGAPANVWTLADVEAGRRAVIAMSVPGAEVRFAWSFGDGPDA